MVLIVESKDLQIYPTRHVHAPPPYSQSPVLPTPTSPQSPSPRLADARRVPGASWRALPQHVLLIIVAACVPDLSPRSPSANLHAMYWLNRSFRLVSRATYTASMNYLRSFFLPAYIEGVKSPYTADPFPLEPPEATLPESYQRQQQHVITSLQRETSVLDKFITIKCTEDLRSYESPELHLDLDPFKDVFDHLQPKARTEDLLRKYGMRAGVISVVAPPMSPTTSISTARLPVPLPLSAISINYSPRKVGLVVLRRTIVDVRRERDESLESVAKRLIKELARVIGRA